MTKPFMSIQLRGMEMLKKTLERLPEKSRKKVSRRALKKSAQIVEARAKDLCPVDSGKLRNSIKTKVTVGTRGEKAVISAGDSDAWYAQLVEWGFQHTGHGMRGKRKPTKRGFVDGKAFMRNAAEQTFEDTIDVFEETIADVVSEEMEKMPKAGLGES